MLLIRCPYCGDRAEIEYANAGEAHIVRPADPMAVSDEEWAQYLYMRDNPKGLIAERWRHSHGCGRFFNAIRDTRTDRFVMTYEMGQPRPTIDSDAAAEAAR